MMNYRPTVRTEWMDAQLENIDTQTNHSNGNSNCFLVSIVIIYQQINNINEISVNSPYKSMFHLTNIVQMAFSWNYWTIALELCFWREPKCRIYFLGFLLNRNSSNLVGNTLIFDAFERLPINTIMYFVNWKIPKLFQFRKFTSLVISVVRFETHLIGTTFFGICSVQVNLFIWTS